MSAERRTLVILAAGMGSRYGGLKQLDPIGPGGATLIDYSIYAAARAGLADVVVIVRPHMDEVVGHVLARWSGVRVQAAHQSPGKGRSKPWGTAHAVLAARSLVGGAFAVVNADDFYGAEAFAAARGAMNSGEWAVVGYRLRDTVPESGGVSRAVCRMDATGHLVDILEVTNVARDGEGFRGTTASGTEAVPGEALVSMNMWAFTPAVFADLARGFEEFKRHADPGDEFLLPTAIREVVRRGARVRLRERNSTVLGMTEGNDLDQVGRKIS